MANYMYLNLSGAPLEVYGTLPIASKVGDIENNEVYVVSKETSSAYHVYFSKDGKLQSGQIKKELASSAMKNITERPYARKVINGTSYFVYRIRKDSNLYDSAANYTGYVKAGMFVACADGLAGTSYPYLKHISYVMTSKGNKWQVNEGFVDTGLRSSGSPSSINMYGNWGGNVVAEIPEPFEDVNEMFINAGSAIQVTGTNGSVIGTIPSGHVYIIKQTIGEDGNKHFVHFCKDNTRYLGYVSNITSTQKTSILERAFRKENINGTQHYVFQIKKQRRVYDSSGGSWGRVGTYMLVACTDAKVGNSNSHYKKINYLQKTSDLSWVPIYNDDDDDEYKFGFVDTGLFDEGSGPTEVCMYGSWGGNTLRDPRAELPYTVDHISVDSTGKRTLIPMKPEYLTIHSTANLDSDAWGERSYLLNPENTSDTAFHIVVDYKEAIEVIPLDEVAYHCGNLAGNKVTVGIEICESGDREKTLQNAIKVASDFLNARGWTIAKLRRHKDWAIKECPRIFTTHQASPHHTWEWFIGEIKKNLSVEPMYTSTTMTSIDRYSYNVHKILNKGPVYFATSDSISSKKKVIEENMNNFLGNLDSQFTTRQREALLDVVETLKEYTSEELNGVHEFRYEGAGNYRSGNSENDTYNSSKVSKISIDFTDRQGQHFDGLIPEEWADGIGLYGALSVVYRQGDFLGVFFRSSTLPDQMEQDDTAKDGVYSFKVGTHPMSGGYKALNVYTLDGSRTLPALIDNTAGEGISGVNSHMGYNTERGSEGCFTIPKEDYDDYIDLFNSGENGKITVKRVISVMY